MKKKFALVVVAVLVLLIPLGAMGIPRAVVYDLSRPKPAHIPKKEKIGEYAVEEVRLTAKDGVAISGWFTRVPGKKAVVLLHGIGANRMQHIEKAALYTELGYGVLCYDARSHGASETTLVTGGWNERMDLAAAVDYLRQQGYERIGLDGFSMGAATIAYSDHEVLKPAFIVLESCFKDVETLITNAVTDMGLPAMMAGPVLGRIESELGVPVEELSPIARMPRITAPTLILLGDSEFQVKKAQADEMLAASGAKVKRLLMFEKAGHDIFSVTQPEVYRKTLVAFLEEAEREGPINHGGAEGTE